MKLSGRVTAYGPMVCRINSSLSYFSLHPVLHDWCSKGCGMCYPVCEMVHIKEPLLLIRKSSLCRGSSGFPLSLSEWSFTICRIPHKNKQNVLNVSLNKILPSLLHQLSSTGWKGRERWEDRNDIYLFVYLFTSIYLFYFIFLFLLLCCF